VKILPKISLFLVAGVESMLFSSVFYHQNKVIFIGVFSLQNKNTCFGGFPIILKILILEKKPLKIIFYNFLWPKNRRHHTLQACW
jgi:hypothetical protein